MSKFNPQHIIVSRTDGIGDVVLTLPLVGALRAQFPKAKITVLGRSYTEAVVAACCHADSFANWDEVAGADGQVQAAFIRGLRGDIVFHVFPRKEVVIAAAKAQCPMRIATARRWHTMRYANVKLWYSRKKSEDHEAALNLKMIEALGVRSKRDDATIVSLYGFAPTAAIPAVATDFCSKPNTVLLHPMSHGSALEWPLTSFARLIGMLSEKGMAVGITGTAKERALMADALPWHLVSDFCGKLNLHELIAVIHGSTGLVAASTGPLHIAAALGRNALGLYSPKRPIHAKRWRPIGLKASYIESESHPEDGKLDIDPAIVATRIAHWEV